jgi:serine/threonine protein kinase
MCPTDPWVRIRLPRGEWFYDPVRPLGPAGGFGEVFEGKDQAGEPVAVKRLKVTAGEAAHRELKIADELAGKSFQHALAALDSGEDSEGGQYFVVMPQAERSLADELGTRGMLSSAEATDILRQIAEGLKEVEGLIHRDLKPGNVLYHDGRWKIADFGIARFVEDATSTNTVRGFLSAPYAAPEQWTGERATHATDVYALSCVAYVLLRGEPPFRQRQKHAERSTLIKTGEAVLRDIIAGLKNLARQNAPEASIQAPHSGKLSIVMGQAYLAIEFQGGTPPDALFPNARWNVLAIGQIRVGQGGRDEWSHGATLWYMELQTHAGYRWYEVAYKRHALVAGPLIGPFPIQDIGYDRYGEADRAAGPGMHTIEVEFGPAPIDDEDAESFFERWLERLAQAYGGRLRPF